MDPVIDARRLLRKHGLRPRKRLGQHFLTDRSALLQVARAAELDQADRVLEIGAGLGSLTLVLAEQAGWVIAVELDQRLIPILQEVLGGRPQVQLVQGDILQLDLETLMGNRSYSVVANIPYNITSALIRRLTEAGNRPERLVLTVQREVAERAMAEPGAMSLLSLSVQVYGSPSIAGYIPPRAFYPRPAVESAVLRLDRHNRAVMNSQTVSQVFELARAGFAQRRKMLKNALAAGLGLPAEALAQHLERAGIQAKARAQELALDDWVRLAEVSAMED